MNLSTGINLQKELNAIMRRVKKPKIHDKEECIFCCDDNYDDGYDYKNHNLIALAGVYQPSSNIEQSKVPIALQNYLNKYKDVQDIVLHFDNDRAGREATKAMIIALSKYNVYDIPAPYGKDINDYLCYKLGLKKRQEIEQYKYQKVQNR